jgi:HSP20 family protein
MLDENSPVFFKSFDELKQNLDAENNERRVLNLPKRQPKAENNEQWFEEDYEGQLSVDVYQTKELIIVKSTIAGVKPEDLEIYLHNDLLTIRGKREQKIEEKDVDYFYKECYWGGFSRSIILPVDVQADKVEANFKDGILTIILPKSQKSKLINIKVKED